VREWGGNYCLVGPYVPGKSELEFEACEPCGPVAAAVRALRDEGLDARFGRWLVPGHPAVVLLNPACVADRLNAIKREIWEREQISLLRSDAWLDNAASFGFLCERFFKALCADAALPVIGHFHEWMSALAIPALRRGGVPVATVFTTHATQIGRFLAMESADYQRQIGCVDWLATARRFQLEAQASFERAAAQGAHVFTTVSRTTAVECEHLLGRRPDVILPNGLNIERFVALHEFQNLHRMFKEQIQQFVIAHFFPSYTFDLDRTLYFFTSGRYEYGNKGFDLAIDAMAKLNWRIRQSGLRRTIVFFLITNGAFRCINSEVMRKRAVLEEIRQNCREIQARVGSGLFEAAVTGQTPRLDDLVGEYWRLRLRRNLQAWRTQRLPPVVTHDLNDEAGDPVLRQLRECRLTNHPDDPVKVVFHPDFVTSSDPLFGMDYDQFVRGCHFGLFPSRYEPWGYAPLECAALGIPSITSDSAGLVGYMAEEIPDHEERGLLVVRRRGVSFEQAAAELAEKSFRIAELERRERIALRNRAEDAATHFDWSNLGRFYREAHVQALARVAAR
jgi:glycogen(starch) synthase